MRAAVALPPKNGAADRMEKRARPMLQSSLIACVVTLGAFGRGVFALELGGSRCGGQLDRMERHLPDRPCGTERDLQNLDTKGMTAFVMGPGRASLKPGVPMVFA